VTGESGGGKSTLTIETLYKNAAMKQTCARDARAPARRSRASSTLDKVIDIDQRPIGRTPRSNPATYVGAFTPIRDWFAGLPESPGARLQVRPLLLQRQGRALRGLPGRRSHQDRDALPARRLRHLRDLQGQALQPRDLEVLHKGKSIADVLDMTVEDAQEFFRAVPSIREKMDALVQVGLGYVKVGPAGDDALGRRGAAGEALQGAVAALHGPHALHPRRAHDGLHFEDVRKLLEVLHELVDQGTPWSVIEHNLDVVKTADWVIDIGPRAATAAGGSWRRHARGRGPRAREPHRPLPRADAWAAARGGGVGSAAPAGAVHHAGVGVGGERAGRRAEGRALGRRIGSAPAHGAPPHLDVHADALASERAAEAVDAQVREHDLRGLAVHEPAAVVAPVVGGERCGARRRG
jgi:hypothetical protein